MFWCYKFILLVSDLNFLKRAYFAYLNFALIFIRRSLIWRFFFQSPKRRNERPTNLGTNKVDISMMLFYGSVKEYSMWN